VNKLAKTEESNPSAEAMVLSLRAMGYDLSTAIADLVDNSITAHANLIRIDFSWNDGEPWILISDDGDGMSESELKKAMKPGSQSPNEVRKSDDLGRFGLGLKTASWSQCKEMTVLTLKGGNYSNRCWNLDYVVSNDKWELLLDLPPLTRDLMLKRLITSDTGTAVLWQNLDRVIGDFDGSDSESMKNNFQEKMVDTVKSHLEMVFHRYLTGRQKKEIFVGEYECEPWDPFLTSHESTEEITTEKYQDDKIVITPYILPHSSKMTELEKDEAQGPNGWALQQGFYVYRQKRMIICGGYLDLGLKPMDHHRLCRIKVDITNDLDEEWRVDVKKATASPPLAYRGELMRIAVSTREKSTKRYRARTQVRPGTISRPTNEPPWLRKKVGTKFLYKINRKHPGIEYLREDADISRSKLNAILHLVEKTVPHRSITVDNNDLNDSTVDLPDNKVEPPQELIDSAICFVNDEISRGKSKQNAVDYVCQIIFPISHPKLMTELEKKFLR
tara:strand:+ start:240 stop:1745 length:1506 start_codon:yes stop_codon:yes gene_type:complete